MRTPVLALGLLALVPTACGGSGPAGSDGGVDASVRADGPVDAADAGPDAGPDGLPDGAPDATDVRPDAAPDEPSGDGRDLTLPDAAGDASPDGGGDGLPADAAPPDVGPADAADVPADAAPSDAAGETGDPWTVLALDLRTEGGFTGRGDRDAVVRDGTLAIHDPFGRPPDCARALTGTELAGLLAAAVRAHEAGIAATYVSPENPECCCDQFRYALTLDLGRQSGARVRDATEWCSESVARLPAALIAFLSALRAVGDGVRADCH